MTNARHRYTALSIVAAAAMIAACGGSDDTADAPADDASSEQSDDAGASESGGGDTAGTVGAGILRIDGVENAGFSGECEIARGAGSEDVGDVSAEGKSLTVAIDNVDPEAVDNATDLNFIVFSESSFRVRNQSGEIASIAEVGTRTTSGSRDYVTVLFTGTLDDGRSVEAEIYCELQNQF